MAEQTESVLGGCLCRERQPNIRFKSDDALHLSADRRLKYFCDLSGLFPV